MKILHFAGLHLDRSFADGGLPASVGRIRREGLIETFIQICEIANSRAVDAVTIAGDLFEEATVMLATLNMLSEQFTKLAPIQVLIAPGQSDAYSQDSIYAQWHFPENVHIFDAQSLSAFHLLPEITIWGAAYPHPPKSKLLRSLKKASKGIDLLLLHEPNARPSKNKNIKLALLGGEHHYRTFSGGVMVGSPEIIEPGVEKLEYGVCLVTHEQGDIKTEFIKTGTWQYEYTEVDLSECENLEDVENRIWQAVGNNIEQNTYYTITLTGSPKCAINASYLTEAIEGHMKFIMRLNLQYDLGVLVDEPTVRGFLAKQFLDQMEISEKDEQNRLLNAAHIALQSLDGAEEVFNAVDPD